MLWVVVYDGAFLSLNFPISFESERPKRGTVGHMATAQGMMRYWKAGGKD